MPLHMKLRPSTWFGGCVASLRHSCCLCLTGVSKAMCLLHTSSATYLRELEMYQRSHNTAALQSLQSAAKAHLSSETPGKHQTPTENV